MIYINYKKKKNYVHATTECDSTELLVPLSNNTESAQSKYSILTLSDYH